jgi:hypothetical protein
VTPQNINLIHDNLTACHRRKIILIHFLKMLNHSQSKINSSSTRFGFTVSDFFQNLCLIFLLKSQVKYWGYQAAKSE